MAKNNPKCPLIGRAPVMVGLPYVCLINFIEYNPLSYITKHKKPCLQEALFHSTHPFVKAGFIQYSGKNINSKAF